MRDAPADARTRADLALRLAQHLARLVGWRRYGLAALLGALAAAALPPLYLLPLLWPAFTGLLWLLDGARRRRQAFAIGWAFGAGHFLVGFYWVGIAFLVEAERFAALMPFAVAGLVALIACFPAAALLALHVTGARGAARLLLLAAAWLIGEWLRSWVLTGFPWNLIGTVWAFSDEMIQLAALGGIWGLSAITVIAAGAPALLGDPWRGAGRRRWWPLVLALALVVLPWGGGWLRLSQAPAPGEARVEGADLRLVQPSIAQDVKWHPELRRQHLADQMAISISAGFPQISHVIWPETAVPYDLSAGRELRRILGRVVPAGGLLITGAPRGDGEGRGERLWNSLHALDRNGEIRATYDKHKLVPFGEYIPLRGLSRWLGLAKLTAGRLDFSRGPGPRTLALPGLPPVSPLICYEVIFSGRVVAPGPRPGWLLTLTNDAWFGVSSGPYQHFAAARLRAVEEGLPLVRAANNGISAVIDAYGRVLARLPLNAVGVIDTPLPRPLAQATPYASIGGWTIAILTFCLLALGRLSVRARPTTGG